MTKFEDLASLGAKENSFRQLVQIAAELSALSTGISIYLDAFPHHIIAASLADLSLRTRDATAGVGGIFDKSNQE